MGTEQRALALGDAPGRQAHPVVLSYGLGVDSTALLLRWLREPDSRDFDLSELLVITAMTGDEWPRTGELVERHVLPRLAAAGVRYVQVARRSASQRDGIAILDDSRTPRRVHLAGAYRLSQELLEAGTVPQAGGNRLCSAKSKGFPLDTFLDGHVSGAFRQAVGFAAGEEARARRDATYDRPGRRGVYPLIEWGWDRDACLAYIQQATGVEDWPKSACWMCPFALASKSCRERTMRRFADDPQRAVAALALEHLAVSLNDRQGLAAGARAVDLVAGAGHGHVLARLQEHLDVAAHALYEVRRILRARRDDPGKLANASRHLRVLATGSRGEMDRQLRVTAARLNADLDDHDGIRRAWLQRRNDGLPAREHFLVAAPAGAKPKGDERFESWWEQQDPVPLFAAA